MTEYAVVRATPEHGAYVAKHMRAADRAEVWASHHHTPAEAVCRSMAASRDACFAGLANGVPACVFGVAKYTALSSVGAPWLLTTDELPRHARTFLRGSRIFYRQITSQYSTLENYVDARNHAAIEWLKWLGFVIGPAEPFGPENLPFHKFGTMPETLTIRKCALADIEQNANFPALAKEYAAESAILELPPPDEKIASYRALDGSGLFHAFGAFIGDVLVGFLGVLLPIIPHYGIAIATTESFFVGKAYRKRGVGLKLLRAAEQFAREAGSPALMVSAPVGGPLADVLPHVGYRETNRVFLRRMA